MLAVMVEHFVGQAVDNRLQRIQEHFFGGLRIDIVEIQLER